MDCHAQAAIPGKDSPLDKVTMANAKVKGCSMGILKRVAKHLQEIERRHGLAGLMFDFKTGWITLSSPRAMFLAQAS